MRAPEIPIDEAERLADLEALHILDSPPEERFDRLARLASQIFRVPMAFISLVDRERQWFKARVGIEAETTGRAVSFCGHAILGDELLVVSDAQEDDRFRDNPLVTGGPRIRFYAGHPLSGPRGHNVGTLCIASPEPRELSEVEAQILKDLAALAERELRMFDLIQAQRELLEVKDQLLITQRQLQDELAEAAAYVHAMLPEKLDGPIRTDWAFQASSQLGGDLFGYHWLDDQYLAVYLFDVCGHGVGASLLALSIFNALKGQSLPDTNFHNPGKVLRALNQAFPMEAHNNKFFTIWYGVYDTVLRALHHSCAGHPPALLHRPGAEELIMLGQPNFVAGFLPNVAYETESVVIDPGSRLYLFSDGVYEIERADGRRFSYEGFIDVVAECLVHEDARVHRIHDKIRHIVGEAGLADDFSLLEIEFE